MMRARLFTAVMVAAAFLLPGCGVLGFMKRRPAAPEAAPEATLPTWIGRVVMVDTDHRFALVDTGAPLKLSAGQKMIAFRDRQRTSSLVVTPDNRPPFLAAEISDGEPALGDQVALDESRPPEALPAD
ncbi:MAG: hypothetical protein WCI38_00965 [Chthoniobacterales bacterium]|jgi:hypothetical protein